MKSRQKRKTVASAGVNRLINKIIAERQKIGRCEAAAVVCHIRLGHHLAALRPLAKNDWGTRLKAAGISPRVASRYLKIASYWPNEIGLRESDLLSRLPPDLLKLEWLCRVPQAQLGGLLDELDCKTATRPQVIAAVREILGTQTPAKDESELDVDRFARRLLDRLKKAVDKLHEIFPEPEQHDRVRELLTAGFREVLDFLEGVSLAESKE